MKKLSDYKDEEAVLLWADLLDGFTDILADKDISDAILKRKPALIIAKTIVQNKPKEACNLMLRIDDTPVDGLNLVTRLVEIILEIMGDPTIASFFESQAEARKQKVSYGSATENTEENKSQDISSNM